MSKLIYIVLMMVMIASCSQEQKIDIDDTLPEYDVEQYCQKWAEDSKKYDIEGVYNHSVMMVNHCMKAEKTDYEWLKSHWNLLPSRLKAHCKKAVKSDQSYETLRHCSLAAICFEDQENLQICEEHKRIKAEIGY